MPSGKLFVVATPIGNLDDISARALRVFSEVAVIAAEDTRHSRKLLQKYAISTPLTPHHQHNQSKSTQKLLERLQSGQDVALISDAGTPLISDPGSQLVQKAHENDIAVVPIPGASSITCALSVSGFAFQHVHFEGFLPASKNARRKRLQQLNELQSCLVIFEAPHRIAAATRDMSEILGNDRKAMIAREMTKVHEVIQVSELETLAATIENNSNWQKGEMVIVIGQNKRKQSQSDIEIEQALRILLDEVPVRQAADIAAKLFGQSRNVLYKQALQLKENTAKG